MSNKITYNEPLQVICINAKHSIKLIEGATYYALTMYQLTSSKQKNVQIKDVGYFDASYFSLLNGKPLDKEQDFITNITNILNIHSINYTGQFVRCRTSKLKTFKLNQIYYVEEQITTRYISKYNNKSYPLIKLKIKGIERPISPYNFVEIPIAEQRCIKLKNISGNNIFEIDQERKFLHYSEKERISILFEILYNVLKDVNKTINSNNELNLTKLMLKKGTKYSIIIEDIKDFLKPDIKKMLTPYNFEY